MTKRKRTKGQTIFYKTLHKKRNNCKSSYFSCNIGVRQGENLSTFLFALFLNDLQSFLEKENLPGLKAISEKIEENLFETFRSIVCRRYCYYG